MLRASQAGADICAMHPRAAESPAALHASCMAVCHPRKCNGGARILGLSIFPGPSCPPRSPPWRRHCASAAESEAEIVHCSFGHAEASPLLAEAVSEVVLTAGKLLVASAPARGAPVYPAGCAGVLSCAGRCPLRCAGQWSLLNLSTARNTAPARAVPARRCGAPAWRRRISVGCWPEPARVAGLRAMLQTPSFTGRERMSGREARRLHERL